jgi:hypothetical protein
MEETSLFKKRSITLTSVKQAEAMRLYQHFGHLVTPA